MISGKRYPLIGSERVTFYFLWQIKVDFIVIVEKNFFFFSL